MFVCVRVCTDVLQLQDATPIFVHIHGPDQTTRPNELKFCMHAPMGFGFKRTYPKSPL